MTANELEHYLHAHFPLAAAMQVSVLEASPERVVLAAPLAPNLNHRETVFGGSASAVAILAAWCVLHMKLLASGISTRLVIQRNSMRYEQPIAGNFTATASPPSPEAWSFFARMFQRRGRARILAASTLWYAGQEAGHFEGDFVALRS